MWSVFRKFQKLFSVRQKRQLIMLFFLMLIGAFLEILGVSLIVPLVSVVMQENIINTNPLVGGISRLLHIQTNRGFLIFCVLLLIFVFIFKDLYLVFEIYMQNRFVYHNRFRMQQRLMNVYLNRGYEYYLNASSGEIVRVVQQDVHYVFSLLSKLLSFTTELVVSLAIIVVVFIINPMMTLLIGIILLLTMWVIAKVAKPMLHRQGEILQESAAQTNKWLLQMVNGIKEILVGDKREFFVENFNRHGLRMVRAERWNNLLDNIPRLLIEMSSMVSMLFALLVAVLIGVEVSTLVPTIAAFAMAALKLMPSANRISSALNMVAYYEPSLDNLLKSLSKAGDKNEEGEIVVDDNSISDHKKKKYKDKTFSIEQEVKMCSVSYCYPGAEHPILQDADMWIPVGKSVGIVGMSGAGKTTVVDIILGLLHPQSGEVFADGVSVKEYYEEWLSHVGYIPQMIFMLDDTIRANVAFGIGRDSVDEVKVWKALEEAQLAEFVKALPEGLDTEIGERGIRLSGGQRQRIGIARALYPNPELLFFDEATSALDTETEAAIMESINRLHGRKTLVIIAHRLATIEECDIVYRVGDGKIVRER